MLPTLKDFMRGKLKSDQVYEINKLPIHYLLKANINLEIR